MAAHREHSFKGCGLQDADQGYSLFSNDTRPTKGSPVPNQFFDDFNTTTSWTYGIGVDHEFSNTLYGGLQFFQRDLEVPFTRIDEMGIQTVEKDDWQEDIGSAYLYWAVHDWITLGLEYYYEDYSHEEYGGPMEILNLTSHRLTPKLCFSFTPRESVSGSRHPI